MKTLVQHQIKQEQAALLDYRQKYKELNQELSKIEKIISKSEKRLEKLQNRDVEERRQRQQQQSVKRKTLPQHLRLQVWDRHFSNKARIGRCVICNTDIKMEAFECAHIESVANGGTNDLKNLIPTCQSCNRSMGTQNAWDFKKEFYPSIWQQYRSLLR